MLSLLKEGTFHEKLGDGTLYILLDEEKLTDGKPSVASFATFCDRDEVISELRPWIGFVFTFPAFRGKRHIARLMDHICSLAKNQGLKKYIFLPTRKGFMKTSVFPF